MDRAASPRRKPRSHRRRRSRGRPQAATTPCFADHSVPEPARRTRSQKLAEGAGAAGLGSRREMEELIRAGKVKVNGALAPLGMRVGARDRDLASGRRRSQARQSRLPRSHRLSQARRRDRQPRRSARPAQRVREAAADARRQWLAVGRLDYNTGGLLIFTDLGRARQPPDASALRGRARVRGAHVGRAAKRRVQAS